ncbi:MAG: TPM domain-containing protein [Cyanobacteria bacterium REEB67]|nr:TPM domain-containing protein [Cyanobacteria bacterium REEB67]
MSDLPAYIPAKAPAKTVTDLSGRLASSQLDQLNKMGSGLSYKARVIIMPADYKAKDAEQLHSLAKDIARDWHVEGDRLLMVIDLSGRKIRTIAGRDLSQSGVNNDFIQRTILPDYFYPYVKKGDVGAAINNSLTAINARELAFKQSASGAAQSSQSAFDSRTGELKQGVVLDKSSLFKTYPYPESPPADFTVYFWFGGFIVLALALYFAVNNAKKDKNNRLNQALTDRLGTLYKAADELGQASDYLPPQQNKELALKVSAFFEKLQTIDKAKEDIEKLTNDKQWGKANDGLLPALQLSDNLNAEAKILLEQVNALTGGVALNGSEEEKKIAAQVVKADLDNHKITVNIRPEAQPIAYARPSWTYAQEYTPNLSIGGGGGGIFDTLLMLNQIETNNRLDRLDAIESSRINNYDRDNRNLNDNSNYNPNSGNTDSGGSWDSSSSSTSSDWSSSTDSGGSWDSGSSDSSDSGGSFDSGSDSGGSW